MGPKFTVLLSASVPTKERSAEFRKIPNAQTQIEQAVIALARNVFQAGGQLIFGGHPSISPLVLMVAMEYDQKSKEIENIQRNEPQLKPINIYQSEAFREVMPQQTIDLLNLGLADIIWTEAIDGEKYNPELKGQPQCPRSLWLMRTKMINQNIDALVCIGGMEGTMDEFRLFSDYHSRKPIYVFESTGGASEILAREFTRSEYIKVIDRVNYNFPESDNKEFLQGENKENNEPEKIEIVPYTFFTALIVRDLIEGGNYYRVG